MTVGFIDFLIYCIALDHKSHRVDKVGFFLAWRLGPKDIVKSKLQSKLVLWFRIRAFVWFSIILFIALFILNAHLSS